MVDLFRSYVQFSLIVGVVFAATTITLNWKRIRKDKTREILHTEYLDSMADRGHIHKVVFGERTVYYRKDMKGEAAKNSVEWMERIFQKHIALYLILILIVETIGMAVIWPKELYDYVVGSKK